MKAFVVTYIGPDGHRYKELFESPDIETLSAFLQRQPIYISKIRQSGLVETFFAKFFAKRISDDEITEVLNTLHIIVRSGLPVHQGLEDLALETRNSRLKKMLLSIADAVANGSSFSEALELYTPLFGQETINLVRIGESSGVLEETLLKAKEFKAKTAALKRKLKSAMIYPALVLTVALSAILVWFIFVLPQLETMFVQMDIELPWVTRFLMGLSDVISASAGYLLVLITVGSLLFGYFYRTHEPFRYYATSQLLKLPLIASMIKEYNVAYITEFLQLSIAAGTPLFKAVQTISNNMENLVFKQSMRRVQLSLEQGESFSKALQKEQLYSSFAVRMLNIGEKSGDLETQLYTIASYYYERVNYFTDNVTKIIEPVIIVLIGGFFALIMVGLMGPIFDIVAQMQ